MRGGIFPKNCFTKAERMWLIQVVNFLKRMTLTWQANRADHFLFRPACHTVSRHSLLFMGRSEVTGSTGSQWVDKVVEFPSLDRIARCSTDKKKKKKKTSICMKPPTCPSFWVTVQCLAGIKKKKKKKKTSGSGLTLQFTQPNLLNVSEKRCCFSLPSVCYESDSSTAQQ